MVAATLGACSPAAFTTSRATTSVSSPLTASRTSSTFSGPAQMAATRAQAVCLAPAVHYVHITHPVASCAASFAATSAPSTPAALRMRTSLSRPADVAATLTWHVNRTADVACDPLSHRHDHNPACEHADLLKAFRTGNLALLLMTAGSFCVCKDTTRFSWVTLQLTSHLGAMP